MAKKAIGIRKPFTEEELQYIKETPIRNLKDLAFMMGRSYDSVRRKKWRLDNIERDRASKNRYREKEYNSLKEEAKNTHIVWAKWEEELILKSKETDKELAKRLQRTVGSIQTKRTRLLQDKRSKK